MRQNPQPAAGLDAAQPSRPKANFFHVFVKGDHCLVIPDEEATYETYNNLRDSGFQHIWDSAPSEFAGAEYAAKHYGAVIPVTRKVQP